jgi:hypothetical protein
MKAIRNGDTLRLEIHGAEILEWLDHEVIEQAIMETGPADERVVGYSLEPTLPAGILLHLALEITPAPGESDRDIYRKENGVPFV